ncbi:cysteine--tRNA ligase [bacterium SCSIO 12741]|nr:cysteine--tRNA ligase [bacterium SCSIO 12741]
MKLYEKFPLKVQNSLGKKLEKFETIHPGRVGMYVCGPTVYSDVHLGNVRTFMSFDVVYRYLTFLGYKVRYVRNITDVGHLVDDIDEGEDKIAKRAKLENLEPMEIVQKYTNGFHDVMRDFNILPPSIEPTATGHIVEQIQMIQSILDKGLAYEVNGSVYFDVEKYNENEPYGELSGRKIDELQSNSRELDGQSDKRSPLDFALWKKASPEHIMRWPSPWSDGFPGWHLECSVMSSKYLGDQFDIHGGGMDLKFPHHECEIAQCKASHDKEPVKYWLHGNMLTVNGTKMSKSLGNSFLPHELFSGDHEVLDKGYSPMSVRFFMLQTHYSSTLDFSNEALQAAEKGFKKLTGMVNAAGKLNHPGGAAQDESKDEEFKALSEQLFEHMGSDFNTPKTIATLFEIGGWINSYANGQADIRNISETTWNEVRNLFLAIIRDVLGLSDESSSDDSGAMDAAMDVLIQLRNQARQDKDWALSDEIRDRLKEAGIVLKDGKEGTSYTLED